jgi:hypothetical protein
MPGGPVRFTLDDGQTLTLVEDDLAQVYELCWKLAPKAGAISVAALIRGAARANVTAGLPIELDMSQSAAMREAVAMLHG